MAHILVIDDSASMRVFLEQTLVAAGHEVVLAMDGGEGLAYLRRARFDLMITDIFMPNTDGLETIRESRAAGRVARVIAISSKNTVMNMLPAARMLGADATIQKPFTAEQLLATVAEILARPASAHPPGPLAGDRTGAQASGAAPYPPNNPAGPPRFAAQSAPPPERNRQQGTAS